MHEDVPEVSNSGFSMVPHAMTGDRRINATAIRVYCAVVSYSGVDGFCSARLENIGARAGGVSTDTVSRSLAVLLKFGYLIETKADSRVGRVLSPTYRPPPRPDQAGVSPPRNEQRNASVDAADLRRDNRIPADSATADLRHKEDSPFKIHFKKSQRHKLNQHGNDDTSIVATMPVESISTAVASSLSEVQATPDCQDLPRAVTEGEISEVFARIEANPAATGQDVIDAGDLLASALDDHAIDGYTRRLASEVNRGRRPASEVIDALSATRCAQVECRIRKTPSRFFKGVVTKLGTKRDLLTARPVRPPALHFSPSADDIKAVFSWFADAGARVTPAIVKTTATSICRELGLSGLQRFLPVGSTHSQRLTKGYRQVLEQLAKGFLRWERFRPVFEQAIYESTDDYGNLDRERLCRDLLHGLGSSTRTPRLESILIAGPRQPSPE